MAFPAVTTTIDAFGSAGTPPPGYASMHSGFGGGNNVTAAGDGTVHGPGAYAGSYKTSYTSGPDFDLYCQVAAWAQTYAGLFVAGTDWTSATGSGYLCRWDATNTVSIYRFNSGSGVSKASGTQAGATGGYFGVGVRGFVISVYWCPNGSDPTNTASWTLITSYDESGDGSSKVLGSAGQIGLLDQETTSFKWGSLFGGTVSAGPPPANTTPPVVTGNTRQNDILTTDDGTWTNTPTGYVYQWQRENSIGAGAYTNISGETANQYVVRYADKDLHVRCNVTATNGGGSATQASNEVGPGTEVSIWRDDFARAAGAIGLPWSPTPWPGGTDVSPTINGSQHVVDPSTVSHFGATSHLLGGPFHGRIKLECTIPTKVSVSDVALDYCLDVSSKDGYRWQIDSDTGDFLRLWKHVGLGSFTAVGGPYAYTMASGQGLWVEYDPRTATHKVGVFETTGSPTTIATVVEGSLIGGVGPFTSGYAGLGLEIASGSSSSEVGSFTLTQLDVGAVQSHTFAAIPF